MYYIDPQIETAYSTNIAGYLLHKAVFLVLWQIHKVNLWLEPWGVYSLVEEIDLYICGKTESIMK